MKKQLFIAAILGFTSFTSLNAQVDYNNTKDKSVKTQMPSNNNSTDKVVAPADKDAASSIRTPIQDKELVRLREEEKMKVQKEKSAPKKED